ncbi:hypothetical protein BV898_14092 [Hypsibius exemplaris]|uniref:ATP-dependent RNA helicase n=1 Tax=Hypsibius exemplaris TaxID=2072580 RepID=A0A1W0W8T2_HYPEX|nr:hypothetical protein BV898_14092 [Hypsibius exemplaris]
MLECQQDAVPGFEKLELQQQVRDVLNDIELKNQAIPMILQGDNVICAAETGSGKTLANLVPLLDKLIIRSQMQEERDSQDNLRVNSPRALILVPSHELPTQTYEMLVKMLWYAL